MTVMPATHVVERIHRTNDNFIQIDTTIYKPYQYSRKLNPARDRMQQAFCTENNRDNNIEVDLTPPPEG